jgi:hypothetical protein
MNVFIYGGKNREEATQGITDENIQVETGKNYSIDATKGFVIVAFPNNEVDTDFEFDYWVDYHYQSSIVEMITQFDFEGENGDTVFLVFCIVLALIIIICLCCCFICCRRVFKKNTRV